MSAGKQNFKSGAGGKHVNRKEELDQHAEERQEGEFGERNLARSDDSDRGNEGEPCGQIVGEGESCSQAVGKGEPGGQIVGEGEPGGQAVGEGESCGQIVGKGEPCSQIVGEGEPGGQAVGKGLASQEAGDQELGLRQPMKAVRERPGPAQPTWPFCFYQSFRPKKCATASQPRPSTERLRP